MKDQQIVHSDMNFYRVVDLKAQMWIYPFALHVQLIYW